MNRETDATDRISDLQSAGLRLLPVPDGVSCPGGVNIRVETDGLQVLCANPKVARWLESRHEGLWIDGWAHDVWSRKVGARECADKVPDKRREKLDLLLEIDWRIAALSHERMMIVNKAIASA